MHTESRKRNSVANKKICRRPSNRKFQKRQYWPVSSPGSVYYLHTLSLNINLVVVKRLTINHSPVQSTTCAFLIFVLARYWGRVNPALGRAFVDTKELGLHTFVPINHDTIVVLSYYK